MEKAFILPMIYYIILVTISVFNLRQKTNSYIQITSRDRKPITNSSRNKHLETNSINTNTNSKFESNMVYLDLSSNSKNKMLQPNKFLIKEIVLIQTI